MTLLHEIAARAEAAKAVASLAARHGGPWRIHLEPQLSKSNPLEASFGSKVLPLACVTFDLDDTLFPTRASIDDAIESFTKEVQRVAPRVLEMLAARGESLRDVMMRGSTTARKEYPLLAHDFTEIRRTVVLQLAREAGESDPAEVAKSTTEAFLRSRGAVDQYLFEDVMPTLQLLRGQGLKLGSITNGNAELTYAPSLRAMLDFEVSAAFAGAFKPAAAPFLAAARAAGVAEPRHVVHVGDSFRDDVAGARALGMRAVLLRRPQGNSDLTHHPSTNGAVEPDAIISSLRELPELLQAWAPRAQSRL